MVRKILLVDDQNFVGMALGRLLSADTDLQLHCCVDAEAAIDRANDLHPDLILQDLVMPKVDGLTLVSRFRANPSTAKTPIVVLSANDDDETRAKAMAAGASGYLVKLPAREELVAHLRRHLGDAVSPNDSGNGFPESIPGVGLVDRFLQELNEQVRELGQAVERNDAAAMKDIAHRLRGCAATVGARPLATLCGRLEDDLKRDGSRLSAQALATAVAEEAARVHGSLT